MNLPETRKNRLGESMLCFVAIALGFILVILGVLPLPFEDAVPLELESRPGLVKGMLMIGLGLYLILGSLLWMRGRSKIDSR
jgi:hypothetical protein